MDKQPSEGRDVVFILLFTETNILTPLLRWSFFNSNIEEDIYEKRSVNTGTW
ncbi:hypothetical protein SAMN03080606_00262 [Alkaliphilus peptidifermentans DSM 18978]|uniref:Uncharacterized protein n=1 Tax=Alkaliphilus peptidifermentans DSM 18978 TaxID=1120976 RepID=A0A1G5ARQ0_9FIRM|nr:hypothetical protein SAMN03080606_00262 [Alkaliphilus peptidifermentans DSM 18978]